MDKKYSVLLSLYDKEKPEYLSLSLDSMFNQTIKPNEIILVLDGPINNRLKKIINFYDERHPAILKTVPLEKNIGLGLALNEGIKVCKNELIARMDTDDISYSNRIELQLEEF